MAGNLRIAGLTLTRQSRPPTPSHSYLAVAQSLIRGVDCFPEDGGPTNSAHAFLCSHIAECVLKAYAAHMGLSDKALSASNVRHNLVELWTQAAAQGLGVEPEAPEWIEQLNFLHDHPFYMRYLKGIDSFSVPNPQPIRHELKRLLALVVAALPPNPSRVHE